MIKEEIKSRINKLDFQLKEIFDNVEVKEGFAKSLNPSRGHVYKLDIVLEKSDLDLKLNLVIEKDQLVQNNIQWHYTTNSGVIVELTSNKDRLFDDIKEVVDKKRYI